jgi:hypothetical protein
VDNTAKKKKTVINSTTRSGGLPGKGVTSFLGLLMLLARVLSTPPCDGLLSGLPFDESGLCGLRGLCREPLSSGQLALDRPNLDIRLTGGTVLGCIFGDSAGEDGGASNRINGGISKGLIQTFKFCFERLNVGR